MAENNEGRRLCDDLHLIPKRRQARETTAASIIVVVSIILIVLNAVFFGEEACYPDGSQYNTRLPTDASYGLSTVARVSLGAVLSIMLDRLCLVWEERHHLATRYDKSWKKMLVSCFSGIKWTFVGPTVVLAFAVLFVAKQVGVATILLASLIVPLVRVFTSNTESQVEVSRILEDNEMSVANGLAWSYYFGYLEIILPGLKERIREKTQDWPIELSSEKLFILLPLDCKIHGKIEDADRNITEAKADDKSTVELVHVVSRGGLNRPYKNKVHCIRNNGKTYYVLLEYVTTLDTLRKMSNSAKIRALGNTEMVEQVRLFCQTLQDGILENPSNVDCQGKCEPVVYDVKMLEEQGKGLAGLLAERIEEVEGIARQQPGRGVGEMQRGADENLGNGFHGDVEDHGVPRVDKEDEVLKLGEEEEPSLPTKETGKPGDTIMH